MTPLDAWIAGKVGRPGAPLKRADLEAFQLDRLQATLDLVRNRSRFYRSHLKSSPGRPARLEDLAGLPFTTAADLRADPLAFVCVSQDAIQRVVTLDTSGTTGAPKRIYFTAADQELTLDFFQAGMSTFTGRGDRVLILLPGETPGSVGDLLARSLERLGASAIRHGPVRDPALTLAAAEDGGATVMVGVPVHVLSVVRQAAFQQRPLRGVHSVLLTTDHVPDAIKRVVEGALGSTVYNHYGMTETGLGGGVECRARHGLHMREADLYYEVVDPLNGQPLSDGETGELVLTTLTRQGMPLIRYRTGDLGRFIPEPCPCGTVLKTLERVTTRVAGRLRLGDRAITMADLDEAVFPIEGVVNFQASLEGPANRPDLNVGLKLSSTDDIVLQAARQAIENLPVVRDQMRLERLTLTVAAVPSIPPSMAKRAIQDRRTAPA